jgi:FkbM family methyltransferase
MDVGAHVGLFSLLAARQGARVLALEPNPATAEILRENLRLNGFSDAQVRSVAAGERDGVGVLEVPEIYDGRASIVPGWASGAEGTPFRRIEVPIRTIDQEFSGSGFDRIDWLLIDVEGSELQALRGARKTLDRTRRVILEVARGPWREECRRILEADHDLRIRSVEPQSPVTEYWLAERPA